MFIIIKPSFNKKIFCFIKFSLHEGIGTCIDYSGIQPNGFLHYTKRALSDYEVRGCLLVRLLLHVTQFIGWIVSNKVDTYLIFPNVVRNFYCCMGFRHDPKMSTRNYI